VIEPYYDEGGITLYHADCHEILPTIVEADLVLTDPPYGIGYQDRTGRRVVGDNEPFDPAHLLEYGRCVIWGAENFAHLLPPSRGWIVWSKVQDQKLADVSVSNVELAWSNIAKTPQIYNHYWRDWIRRASERGARLHPAMKPVSLMKWILQGWTEPGDLILDPYMGAGPVAQACHEMDRRYIGIEIEESYCQLVEERLAQGTLALR